jgi:hypothetical protein
VRRYGRKEVKKKKKTEKKERKEKFETAREPNKFFY